MIKLLNILSEIKIEGRITSKMVDELIFDIQSKAYTRDNLFLNIDRGIIIILKKYFNKTWNYSTELNNLSQQQLNNLYKELQQFKKENNLQEIKITRSPKTWDLRKPTKIENIHEGDFIQFELTDKYNKPELVKQKVISIAKDKESLHSQDLPKLGTSEGYDWWQKEDIENYYKRYKKGKEDNIFEIKIVPKFKVIPKIYMAKYIKEEDTEYLGYSSPFVHLIEVGNYYTFRPHGDMKEVLLFPKNWFSIKRDDTNDYTDYTLNNEFKYINNLLKQGKFKIINK